MDPAPKKFVEADTAVHYVRQNGEHVPAVVTGERAGRNVSLKVGDTVIHGVPHSEHPAPFTWHLPEPAPAAVTDAKS